MSYITPKQVLEAIGTPLLGELDARDVELLWTGYGTNAVVRFQLGESGQYLGVVYRNLFTEQGKHGGVIGARRKDDGTLDALYWETGQFESLTMIPAAIREVVGHRKEW